MTLNSMCGIARVNRCQSYTEAWRREAYNVIASGAHLGSDWPDSKNVVRNAKLNWSYTRWDSGIQHRSSAPVRRNDGVRFQVVRINSSIRRHSRIRTRKTTLHFSSSAPRNSYFFVDGGDSLSHVHLSAAAIASDRSAASLRELHCCRLHCLTELYRML